MKAALAITGLAFAVLAMVFLYFSFTMDVSVESADSDRVVNLARMQTQEIGFMIGIGSALISTILLAAAAVISAIEGPILELTNRVR